MAKRFPKRLYVKVDGDRGEEYFVADDDLYGLAEMGETTKIAVYDLVEVTEAKVMVETKKVRAR